ncbi:Uncharacterised protein [Raoultella terrigena]|uniref:Uncharacterized protein n=1 Tax=Raoultella terrigena TaxID=577 RepID=A0A3P8K796_RAOTE|nr:Uncharacterised protein [Raoultella terrigena]
MSTPHEPWSKPQASLSSVTGNGRQQLNQALRQLRRARSRIVRIVKRLREAAKIVESFSVLPSP